MTAPAAQPAILADVDVGGVVVVDHVKGVVDATLVRLCEMGLVPGSVVTLTRRAPFGGPLEVSVRGTRLCLRKSDAARFGVRAHADVDNGVDDGHAVGGAAR